MAIINPLPFIFVNGTVGDATQVNADFAQIVANANANAAGSGANSDITSLSGLTTPLTTLQGGTGQATGVPSILVFSSGGAEAAPASTAFLGVSVFDIEGRALITVPFACTLRNMYAQAGAFPGAGETYTYTLRSSGVSQTLTCQTAGGVLSGSHDTTHSVALAAGALIDVMLVTSAGADQTVHTVVFEVDKTP